MSETSNSYTVPQHHIMQFTSNVQMALVRQGGVVLSHVSSAMYTGDKAQVVNFIGPVEFTERDTPYKDTVVTEPEHTQRWINGRDFDCAIFVDRIDKLRMIYDPTSPYVEAMRAAAARKQDEIIVEKFFADARTGKEGTQTTSLPAGNTVAHGGTRMSVAKLRAARKLLKKKHVDLRVERPRIMVTAEQVDDLLGEVTVSSIDYNAVKPLTDGEVTGFMGFEFVPMETIVPSHMESTQLVRDCPVWVPSGMHFGDWQNLAITIGPRADKNNITQIHACFSGGATRLQEEKVLTLQCYE